MSQLDDKINQHFAGLVVRKDLVKAAWVRCSSRAAARMLPCSTAATKAWSWCSFMLPQFNAETTLSCHEEN